MTAIRIIDDHVQLASIGSKTHVQIEGHIQGIGNYVFPAADGGADQVLKTNGAGVLAWIDKNHSIASHNDTSATGAQLDILTDNSIADALHRHSELVASDGSPDPALKVDAAGYVGIGTSVPGAPFHLAHNVDTPFMIHREGGKIRQEVFVYSDTAGDEPQFNMGHSRGTKASQTATQADDELGTFNFVGFTDRWVTSASIRGYAETGYGAIGNDGPGRLVLLTTPDGSVTPVARMTIKRDGHIGIGTLTPATSALMDLTSTTGALLLTRMTTTQRDALTAVNGMLIYNSTLNRIEAYENGSWVDL